MAAVPFLDDPLLALRQSITTSSPIILATSTTPRTASDPQPTIAQATHIQFTLNSQSRTFDFSTPTRFAPSDSPVNLRSIYFTWLNKDASLPDYISAVQRLNEELSAPGGAGGSVLNLSFAQKVELIAWLAGESDSSEYIKPLDGAAASAAVASTADSSAVTAPNGAAAAKGPRQVDPRLLEIYQNERSMGDHNTALRGSKPTDFSQFRATASTFLRTRPSAPAHPAPLVSSLQKKPTRRLEPIILLSPSASSLLRMSNIKSFLDTGLFIPPSATDSAATNLLYLQRLLPTIDNTRPFRFILVDSTTNFKPDYWGRVVCVFTTGQTWQFKSYKYPNPADLFARIPGVFVGWQGEDVPEAVKQWGRGVLSVKVDKWSPVQGTAGRWRDREVVETIWGAIEEGMRARGWTKDGPGMGGGVGGR
ncbi:CDC73-domain-containing protein [Delitschia confertaspora ATCC 74209]|uniref:CDC73-domain-containing protein n=1 Tax=Delitschia confertaspora ATCC 74209 TaxID=1513339 RepID=A0A9P4JGY2_9PLEO|nr:CDC73-domain-containing protein [Delitschia confertaspora ATCC 74209]